MHTAQGATAHRPVRRLVLSMLIKHVTFLNILTMILIEGKIDIRTTPIGSFAADTARNARNCTWRRCLSPMCNAKFQCESKEGGTIPRRDVPLRIVPFRARFDVKEPLRVRWQCKRQEIGVTLLWVSLGMPSNLSGISSVSSGLTH